MKKSEKQGKDTVLKISDHKRKRVAELEDDVDALFRLPLAEFTGARNALAARLKKSGREEEKAEAVRVKALVKPTVSAWAVNQLYWNHRAAFDHLIASGEGFHKAQTSRSAGKVADMREALDARREALTQLSNLAAALLRDAGPNSGQNPTPDMVHRITTTLEALSAYASRSGAPRPGRLTEDVDPPGFELFGSSFSGAGTTESTNKPARVTPSHKSSGATNQRRKMAPDDEVREFAETHKAKIAAAKLSLQNARRSLAAAVAKAQSLAVLRKKADAEAKKDEKQRRDAEERLEKAKAAAEGAARRARSVAVELDAAASAVEDAELKVEKASRELEGLSKLLK